MREKKFKATFPSGTKVYTDRQSKRRAKEEVEEAYDEYLEQLDQYNATQPSNRGKIIAGIAMIATTVLILYFFYRGHEQLYCPVIETGAVVTGEYMGIADTLTGFNTGDNATGCSVIENIVNNLNILPITWTQ